MSAIGQSITGSGALGRALNARMHEQFRGYERTNAFKTVLRVIGEVCPPPGKPLTRRDVQEILSSINAKLTLLRQTQPKTAPAWLENAPFDSAMRAMRNVEQQFLHVAEEKGSRRFIRATTEPHDAQKAMHGWQQCKATWRQGGREQARALNQRIYSQTRQDLEEGRRFDTACLRRSIAGASYDPAPPPVPRTAKRDQQTQFVFKNQDTFDAAYQMRVKLNMNPLVLDMANKKDVGGASEVCSIGLKALRSLFQ